MQRPLDLPGDREIRWPWLLYQQNSTAQIHCHQALQKTAQAAAPQY